MNTQSMIALAIAGALIYISASGMVKQPVANTAMVALGAVIAAKNAPVVGSYASKYL